MPKIDLSMLNQRQTPAFYADVLANRPAAGFIGRIFVSTNTYAFYRDNGTGWDLIGGPGTGTVTGSGTAGQVTYWDGASSITGSNNLFWDSANNRLGINNTTPGASLDIHSAVSSIAQFNQTTATNNSLLVLQNSGSALWRLGNYYNAGANDFGVFDVIGAIQPLTIKKTSGQVLIGTSTVGSGKLVVASASSDNGIQIVGASAPSLRIDSAEIGPTKRAGLGISTATNNFIQGSADRDFCIFNGSTAAASPILFGVYDAGAANVQEAARISAARNFLIGTTTDGGQKLQVNGTVNATGFTVGAALQWNAMFYTAGTNPSYIQVANGSTGAGSANGLLIGLDGGGSAYINQQSSFPLYLKTNGINALTIATTTNVGIGTSFPSEKLEIYGSAAATSNFTALKLTNSSDGGVKILFSNNVAPELASIVAGVTSTGAGTNDGTLIFSTALDAVSSERARLTSTGNLQLGTTSGGNWRFLCYQNASTGASTSSSLMVRQDGTDDIAQFWLGGSNIASIKSTGNLLIGTTTDNGTKFQNNGNFCTGNEIYRFDTNSYIRINGGGSSVDGSSILMFGSTHPTAAGRININAVGTENIIFSAGGATRFTIKYTGVLNANNIPTSPAGLVSGDIYSNLGVLTIVP